jgi:hygromycin-B 7''-O-kinase
VYFVGSTAVVKLFVPFFESDFLAERLVAQALDGALDVVTPAVTAEGEIGGWRYLLLTRVQGRPLQDVWSRLCVNERKELVRQVGEFIGSLRVVSLDGLEALALDWEPFVRTRVAARNQELAGVRPELARGMSSYVGSSTLSRADAFRPILLLSDITREHVMVEHTDNSWRHVSYVDFGDAMIGPREYEVVAPGVDMVRGDPELLQELLMAAGYTADQLDEELRHRLMTCTLVHRYLTMADLMSLIPEADAATSVEDLASVVWPIR